MQRKLLTMRKDLQTRMLRTKSLKKTYKQSHLQWQLNVLANGNAIKMKP